MAGNTIKILIVDDHPLVRQGMKKVIEKEDTLRVISEAGNAEEAIRCISKEEPDILIADISMEGEASGIDLVKAVKERYPRIRCLVLSMHDENIYAERALRAGSMGYVTKKEAPSVIIKAIKTVMEGNIYLSSNASMKIISRIVKGSDKTDGSPVNTLSNRELEIFRMIGSGLSTGDISKKLNLSVNTIESHRKKIKDKLGILKGSELTKEAIQWVIRQNE